MVHPLLFLLARSSHGEMARQIQFLKEENRILRSKLPRRITSTRKERTRLVRLGVPPGPSIERQSPIRFGSL
jgi:putative transposase